MVNEIRVLHVDDEPDFAELTVELLELEDDRFETVTETSASDGLDRLADEDIDCIVSDYEMRGMDGLKFLDALRENYPDLPFILFTGQGSEQIASNALSAGVTEYLQKRGGSEQYKLLANRIENAVESYRAQKRVSDLERIRNTVQAINQALVRASSREEMETRACDIISDIESVRFVAISEVDPETNRIEPRTWAGVEEGYLDDIDITVAEQADDQRTPHERAFYEREVAASPDIQEDPAFEPWSEAVSESGLHALVVVPLEYEDELYGLLALYGGRPQPIDDAGRELLMELGDDIGYGLGAIESRRKLAASEARYRALTETVSDAILTIDSTSTITYANPSTEQLFGYSREELRGAELTRLMPERLRDLHQEGIGQYLQTGERELDWTGVELPGQHEDGTEIPLSISFGEFEQDGQQYFTGVIRDVTERTEQKAELQRQNKYLDEFAGIVAHDLRNPLHIARGRLDLARRECESEHFEVITDTLDRMERLIEDLLLLARQGQNVDEVDPVPLADVVDTARRAVDGDTVTVEVDSPLDTITGHRRRVRLLVENLFRNAVEHSSTSPRSHPHEDAVEHGGANVAIRVVMLDDGFAVEDDGPGISDADPDKLFDPGYTTKDDGTGFGLNIVEKIVDAHGWDIVVTEGTDGGARFEITGVELNP